jgi:putative ABC transport system substrate-binding protein
MISYEGSVTEWFQPCVDRLILKSENPSDMLLRQATMIEVAINLKTAKALGLTVPLALLVPPTR